MARFHKMHGLGNDFVVIDARTAPVALSPSRVRAIADRHTGVGFDQLILLEPSETADAAMRIFNADGGEVEACGNAFRAAAVLIGKAVLATQGGTVAIAPDDDDGATAELQPPQFDWQQIPLAYAMDTAQMPVGWDTLNDPMAVNVGNPHVVFFVPDAQDIDLATLGPQIENDPLFPERINVNVASIDADGSIALRTWERGVGLTRACGTGACATAVAAIRSRRATSPVRIAMAGGDLTIAWAPGEPIRMTGPATHVFTGEIDWDIFPL
jgi:diaminopimelate epimerase